MTEIPLILKLKKKIHKDIAVAHDVIIKELYTVFGRAVLHGGTSIWRCYNGNRFSEDVDVYLLRDEKKLNDFFDGLKKKGFKTTKRKTTENSLFSSLDFKGVKVRFEVLFKNMEKNAVLRGYELSNGNVMTIYTLSPEDLIKEKIGAYLNRFKIRDLYDLFFLLRYVDKNKIQREIDNLIKNFKKPIDEKDLDALIIEGIVPSVDKMMDYINKG